ncbi:hypothetical protein SERLADRAFT_404497 [Serpula lacrymans var. lacrymans S7.9]|uniref:Uncharacterized protein n=1 Tax=Serpula lacrymans var. lacrymans (strain S7.9) TaxID=578457 RepID=F8NDJ2_SERL9|nr:uncharacterized protein SERLADRAFT_404497 [Serpula lacrymans var. lacrymans S7.9]EGO30225.1 hypothetical protein SERLADRAFT_404497 [Serpula lacrymans var. lacrymans S7.9]
MCDLYRVKPGQSGYIGKLQSVLKAMLTELSEKDLAELKEKRKEWYINGPSEEMRQNNSRSAKMKGRKVVKDFQVQDSWDLGTLSFVLITHKYTNGTICVSFHEQNDKAVFELFSKVQPNWQNVKIWEAWGKYGQS